MVIEQMLYGYQNGHTLIASSLENKLKLQHITDVLSDAASDGEFTPYVTGYPLEEDGYYALTKTWYAHEMKRPGCVWTHILLFPLLEERIYANAYGRISELFRRPNITGNLGDYTKKLVYEEIVDGEKEVSDWEKQIYQYVLYTLFSSDKDVYIADDDIQRYEDALMDVVLKLPPEKKNLTTFCTGASDNRYFNNERFMYQIVPEASINRLLGKDEEASVYKSCTREERFPIWTQYLHVLFSLNIQNMIFHFCDIYYASTRESVKELTKIFFSCDGFREQQDLVTYQVNMGKIESGELYIPMTLDYVLYTDESPLDGRFTRDSMLEVLFKDIIKTEMKGKRRKMDEKKRDLFAMDIYKDEKKTKNLFRSYISDELDSNGLILVDKLITYLRPDDLDGIFGMDRNICSVVIRRKPTLALCANIWKQDAGFQKEMLGAAASRHMSDDLKQQLAERIVEYSIGGIADFTDSVLGDTVRIAVFDRITSDSENLDIQNTSNSVLLGEWLPVMLKSRDLYLNLIKGDLSWSLAHCLMRLVNPSHIQDEKEKEDWRRIVRKYESALIGADLYEDALFSFGIMAGVLETYTVEFKNWVFDKLNARLKVNEMDFEDWNDIERKLPSVEVERSWDKCLRLRLAFGRE